MSSVALLRRERDFRRVYTAQLVQLGGDWFVLVPLLALLTRLTGSGLWAGLVLAADTVALAAFSPWAGTVVDRADRRRVVVVCDLASAVLVLVLLAVHSAGAAPLAVVVVAGLAAAKAFSTPAASAALPNLVDRADLPAASVLSGASWGVMLTVGGAAGGVLAAVAGERACVLVSCLAYLFAAATVARTRRPFQAPMAVAAARATIREDVGETVGYARRHPRVAAMLLVKSGVGVGNGTVALFPLLAALHGAGPLTVGVLFSARGLGALIGPFALRRHATDPARLPGLLAASMLAYGLCYAALGWVGLLPVTVGLVVLAHVGGGANWVLSVLALQTAVPDHLRGRVFAADLMLATLTVGSSQLLAGLLADRVDTRVLLSCFGAATFLYGVIWYATARRLPAADAVPELDAAVPLGSGADRAA